MKKILFSLAVLAGISATAQVKVGDNPTTINANSVLELESTNKGLLLPRVALTSTGDAAPLSAHVAGMTVYNTATAGSGLEAVTPGEYYNDGTQWVKKAGTQQVPTLTQNVYVNGTDPNSATGFDNVGYYDNSNCATTPINAAFTNDDALKALTDALYIGQSACDEDGDGSEYSYWVYNGSEYIPFNTPESTAWYLNPTKTDAGSTKTAAIKRDGSVAIGEGNNASNASMLVVGHNTKRNPRSAAMTSSLIGIRMVNDNNLETAPAVGLYGYYGTNYHKATTALSAQYGIVNYNYNYGGRVANLKGIEMITNAYPDSKGFTSGMGLYSYFGSQSTDATLINTLYNAYFNTSHSGAGKITNARAIESLFNFTPTSGSFTNFYLLNQNVTNNSTNTDAITTFYGIGQSMNHNGKGRVSNFRGINMASAVGADSGGISSGYGGIITFTNNSTDTTTVGNQHGLSVANHTNGAANTNTQYGLTIDNYNGNTATTGSVNTMQGLVMNTQLRTQNASAAANSTLYGISNTVYNSSIVNTTNAYGINNVLYFNKDGVGTTIRGIFNSVTNTSTGTGNTSNLQGLVSSVSHASNTNAVAALHGLNLSTSLSGKLQNNASVHGIYNFFSGTSTNGNTVSSLYNFYNNASFSSASTDNVSSYSNIHNNAVISTQGNITANLSSINSSLSFSGTGTGTLANLYGFLNYVSNSSKQNITNYYGISNTPHIQTAATGTITNYYGIYSYPYKSSASTAVVTNAYGFFQQPVTQGSVNNYGLYLGAVSGGATNNWAVYSNGGNSYFKDTIAIGTTSPNANAKLDVNGAVKIGTTADANGVPGMIRYNTSTNKFQGYVGGTTNAWVDLHL